MKKKKEKVKKIVYPNYAFLWRSNETETQHLGFPVKKEQEFEEWCKANNIGFEPENIQGITKSDCHVFWPIGKCPVTFVQETL